MCYDQGRGLLSERSGTKLLSLCLRSWVAPRRRQPQAPCLPPPAALHACIRARPSVAALHPSLLPPHSPHAQACLSTSAKPGAKAALKVKVGEGAALLVCALREGATESASLDLIFDE